MSKKRKYNSFAGKRRDSREILEETADRNVQVNDMPDIGQYVVINVIKEMGRSYRENTGIYSIYVYNDAYMDCWGNPIVYRVEGYTKGQDNPLDPTNKVQLISESKNGKLTRRAEFNTVIIATGSMELEVVDPELIKEVGFRKYDGNNLISSTGFRDRNKDEVGLVSEDDIRIVEQCISQGKTKRICRNNKHI